jgi:predicted TIM-barrel fold metal-dependent hydrolase
MLRIASLWMLGFGGLACAQAAPEAVLFHDSHFHLTNYVQEGVSIGDFLSLMGSKVGRVALFGIPLQQQWSHRDSGDAAPSYYLDTDAPLYYYSFTDAFIAKAYLSLPPEDRKRFDPMITGFNPADMYAADHIRRVLRTYPGVFSGIGEFTIHKEFVSSKVAGEVASLQDPAVDRILDFAAEVGLVVILHCDVDVPFPKDGAAPMYLEQMKALLRKHPRTTVIWAHTGVGRVVRPVNHHGAMLEQFLSDPAFSNVYFDISWDLVARYFVADESTIRASAALLNRYPDRFLFGTDEVAPKSQEKYLTVFEMYGPLWKALAAETSEKVRKGNFERIFNAARSRVRKWEMTNGAGDTR